MIISLATKYSWKRCHEKKGKNPDVNLTKRSKPGTQRLWNLLKQKEKQQEEKQRKDFRGMFDRMKKDEEKEKTERDASNKTSETKQIKPSSKSSHNEKIKLNKGEKSAIEKQLEAKLSENEEPRIVELDD
ncbi:8454_t:CDS:2 [Entrophospora sp. SA101]|nr:8454_t:CDS:2 [Entrophospora sp. SA101]